MNAFLFEVIKIKKLISYFTKAELILWLSSIAVILASFFVFDRVNYLTLTASLIGATSLIFSAKGNPFGQLLMVIFSLLYGIISYSFSYYGEMITYLGMTAPMALFSLIVWLKNPYNGKRSQVKIGSLTKKEIVFMFALTAVVTAAFYFILDALSTASMFWSTLSVTTSFLAVYLTFKRNPYYAIAYALNDIVLIILWVKATIENVSYLSVIICFVMFLFNDLYGFFCWIKMEKKQQNGN